MHNPHIVIKASTPLCITWMGQNLYHGWHQAGELSCAADISALYLLYSRPNPQSSSC
jgi:hypothetical protein